MIIHWYSRSAAGKCEHMKCVVADNVTNGTDVLSY